MLEARLRVSWVVHMHKVTCTGRNRLTQPIQKQGKRNHAGERPSAMPMADNPTALHIAGWPGNTVRMKLAQQQSIGHTALAPYHQWYAQFDSYG